MSYYITISNGIKLPRKLTESELSEFNRLTCSDMLGDEDDTSYRNRISSIESKLSNLPNCRTLSFLTNTAALSCPWRVSDSLDELEPDWDGSCEFFDSWIELIVQDFLTPNGITVHDSFNWSDEEYEDSGFVSIEGGVVSATNNEDFISESRRAIELLLNHVPSEDLPLLLNKNKTLDEAVKAKLRGKNLNKGGE